jgi:tetratricopeptide (TPR) repeat protein
MAERTEDPETEALEPAPAGAAGLAVGMAAALGGGKSRAKADPELGEFLREQTRLARLQTEHLHEQRELILSRLRWGRFSDRLKALLQAMTVVVGVAVVVGVGVMAWQAHEDNGLVIDAFSVPPDLARDGLSGEVVAARFLDRLQAMQAATVNSDRPAESFQNNWGSEIQIEIPDTGLTFGEFEKLLRDRFGHVSHVSGEVLKTPQGLALTARIGDAAPQTFAGPETGFDDLAQKAAEAVFRSSQPYRYTEYLELQNRIPEAFQVIADLAANGPPSERGWAYAKWAAMDLDYHGDLASSRAHAAMGLGYGSASDLQARIARVNSAVWSGHDETNLQVSRILDVEDQTRRPDTSQLLYVENKLLGRAWLQFSEPDYQGSANAWMKTGAEDRGDQFGIFAPVMAATALALDHDPGAARRDATVLADRGETSVMWDVAKGAFLGLPTYWIAADDGDWPAALADLQGVDAWLTANRTRLPIYGLMQKVWIWPLEALAEARVGDVAGAQALIGQTPADCYLCVRVRGQIAAQAGDWPGADRWFAEAVRQGPSLPFADTEWGQALLARGDADGAIAKAGQARLKAPHFADPEEVWGEALMRKGDEAGAALRFAAADKDAPMWGRNHLMWGEALMLGGGYAQARHQFETARGLDLEPPDRAALNVLLARTASGPLRGSGQ